MKIYDDGKIFGIRVFIPRAIYAKREEFIKKNYSNVISTYQFMIIFIFILCVVTDYKIQYDIIKIIMGILILGYCFLLHHINKKYNKQAEEGFKV